MNFTPNRSLDSYTLMTDLSFIVVSHVLRLLNAKWPYCPIRKFASGFAGFPSKDVFPFF